MATRIDCRSLHQDAHNPDGGLLLWLVYGMLKKDWVIVAATRPRRTVSVEYKKLAPRAARHQRAVLIEASIIDKPQLLFELSYPLFNVFERFFVATSTSQAGFRVLCAHHSSGQETGQRPKSSDGRLVSIG
jgi:hypothetical protein